MNAIFLASAGVVILLVGGVVGFWLGRSGIGGGKARVEKAEAELAEYKRSVTEHFGQTAAHFQSIGKQYRELYEHMASGAKVLCESDEAGKQLLFVPGAAAASTNVDAPSAEAATGTQIRTPVDYAEQPIPKQAADAPEAADEPADEEQAKIADEADSGETDMAEGSVSETTAEPQPETEAKVREQTLH